MDIVGEGEGGKIWENGIDVRAGGAVLRPTNVIMGVLSPV